jgi:hypothetical protein
MKIAGIKTGDLVLLDVRGARFHGEVTGRDENGVTVLPLQRGITYRHVSPRQVITHWRKAGRATRQRAAPAANRHAKEGTDQ